MKNASRELSTFLTQLKKSEKVIVTKVYLLIENYYVDKNTVYGKNNL